MAFQAGKGSVVIGGTVGLTGYLNQYQAPRQQQAVQTNTFGNDDMNYIAGRFSAQPTVGGLFDGDAGASDETFESMVSDGALQVVTIGHGGGAIGDGAYLFKGICDQYGIQSSVSDAVRINVGFQSSDPVRNGSMLHALEAETGTANFASVDQTASSSNGGIGHLNVTAFTGTDCTIKIQDSANDSTWADLITFSSVTGVTAEQATVTGTVDRYVRAIISAGTFSSVTFTVAFARNRA